jgi:signal transduction histidine kinase/CheY-like chemotaxis protein
VIVNQTSASSQRTELRFSPVPVFIALPILGLLFYTLGETWMAARDMFPLVLFVLLCYLIAGIGWWLAAWKPEIARVFAVVSAVLAAYLAAFWLNFPGAIMLVAVPPVLAVSILGLRAGIVLAAVESLLLMAGIRLGLLNLQEGVMALLQTWLLFGGVTMVALPAHKLADWSWSYFVDARQLLEEARNRQGELARAFNDLAHANQQLTRLNALAQNLRQAADDARLAKEQFVTNVSHELRTPLNMIVGFSEMILDNPDAYGQDLPPALLADLTIVRRNAGQLSDLIDDVLDLSQIEADQMALMREYASLPEIIQAATEAVQPLFHSKQLFLDVHIEGEIPTIFCDRTRIREVLLNLLSNAGRFTEQGGVTVHAVCGSEAVTVSVRDTGPGIQSGQLDRLFQPFQQLDNSIRRRYGGTGLGLSISKRFIEMHGGKIWAESSPGSGTTFYFQLPLTQDAPESRRFTRWMVPEWDLIHRVSESALPRQKARPRLVVAEDGNTLQRLLTRYFGDVDIIAVDGFPQAVQEVTEVPSQMLVINRSEGVQLKDFDPGLLPYNIPVVTCWLPGASAVASSLGATEYLVKPVSKKALLDTISRIPMRTNTVLIVDDEPDALRLFQRILHSSGENYHVLRARNGQEALRILQQYRPDVILMDLVMPNMDGFQLLRKHNADPQLRDIPVIILSARDAFGNPIVTPSITISRKGGISVHDLMQCIRAVSQILATAGAQNGPGSQ